MAWDEGSVKRLLLEQPSGKPKEEHDDYDDLYHEMRRRLALERARKDDANAAGKGRKLTARNPHRPLIWKDL